MKKRFQRGEWKGDEGRHTGKMMGKWKLYRNNLKGNSCMAKTKRKGSRLRIGISVEVMQREQEQREERSR